MRHATAATSNTTTGSGGAAAIARAATGALASSSTLACAASIDWRKSKVSVGGRLLQWQRLGNSRRANLSADRRTTDRLDLDLLVKRIPPGILSLFFFLAIGYHHPGLISRVFQQVTSPTYGIPSTLSCLCSVATGQRRGSEYICTERTKRVFTCSPNFVRKTFVTAT